MSFLIFNVNSAQTKRMAMAGCGADDKKSFDFKILENS